MKFGNSRLWVAAVVVMVFCPAFVQAQRMGKGGGSKAAVWAALRDAPGDAIQSDSPLWGYSKPYIDGQDGVDAWMFLDHRHSWPSSNFSTYRADVRSVWIQGPDCTDGSCFNPLQEGGEYGEVYRFYVTYPVAPTVGETLPAQVGIWLNFAEDDNSEELITLSWLLDENQNPPTITGLDQNGDGVVDTLRVVVTPDSVPDRARFIRSTFLKKETIEERFDLGWTSVPFGVDFSLTQLP